MFQQCKSQQQRSVFSCNLSWSWHERSHTKNILVLSEWHLGISRWVQNDIHPSKNEAQHTLDLAMKIGAMGHHFPTAKGYCKYNRNFLLHHAIFLACRNITLWHHVFNLPPVRSHTSNSFCLSHLRSRIELFSVYFKFRLSLPRFEALSKTTLHLRLSPFFGEASPWGDA